jgi:hypothetical protein
MRIFTLFALLLVTLPFASQAADKPQPAPKFDAGAIPLLSSPDKAKRLAATQAIFKQGQQALEGLKKAGARHSAETPTSTWSRA